LHIVTNNCWTFALDLISYIQGWLFLTSNHNAESVV
jgi:hypothetical protein